MQFDNVDMTKLAESSKDRYELWTSFLNETKAAHAAEIGVFRGGFAERVLNECPEIQRYYMIDPWRHLEDWNKPANRADDTFERFYQETLTRTAAHAEKRVILRGRTTEVVDQIPDESLDFAYIDGDHTLRGITIDLERLYPKIRPGGFIGGDDFCKSMWQHTEEFEPTLVFPFAVYFAEAVGMPILALPHKQFVIWKNPGAEHTFADLAGGYGATTIQKQLAKRPKKSRPEQSSTLATPQQPGWSSLPRRIAGKAKRTLKG